MTFLTLGNEMLPQVRAPLHSICPPELRYHQIFTSKRRAVHVIGSQYLAEAAFSTPLSSASPLLKKKKIPDTFCVLLCARWNKDTGCDNGDKSISPVLNSQLRKEWWFCLRRFWYYIFTSDPILIFQLWISANTDIHLISCHLFVVWRVREAALSCITQTE